MFLSLPVEIQQHVVAGLLHTKKEDVQAFMCTCRTFRSLGSALISRINVRSFDSIRTFPKLANIKTIDVRNMDNILHAPHWIVATTSGTTLHGILFNSVERLYNKHHYYFFDFYVAAAPERVRMVETLVLTEVPRYYRFLTSIPAPLPSLRRLDLHCAGRTLPQYPLLSSLTMLREIRIINGDISSASILPQSVEILHLDAVVNSKLALELAAMRNLKSITVIWLDLDEDFILPAACSWLKVIIKGSTTRHRRLADFKQLSIMALKISRTRMSLSFTSADPMCTWKFDNADDVRLAKKIYANKVDISPDTELFGMKIEGSLSSSLSGKSLLTRSICIEAINKKTLSFLRSTRRSGTASAVCQVYML